MTHKCIYCKKEKDASEFNREHVVPRMMGTYENGFVLNDNQVCKECNTCFSIELENPISLDSFEAFLRMQHGRGMSDGRTLGNHRISLTGNEGVFKGLNFSVVADSQNDENIHLDINPCIGIINDASKNEYNYYTLESLPEATEEILSRIRGTSAAIITNGYTQKEAEPVLKEKGYLRNDYKYSEGIVADLHGKAEIDTAIKVSIDSIMRRVCAKTVFNYLCFSEGKEFVLQPRYDFIRNYIRYGTWDDTLWFRYSQEPVSTSELPNETSHSVGYMMFPKDGYWEMCGCLTWFGQLTYIFKLGVTDMTIERFNTLPTTKMAYFNNIDKTISQDEAVFVYGGRTGDQFSVLNL